MHLVENKQRIRRSPAASFESLENRVNFDNAEELQEIPRNNDAKIRRSKDPPIFKRVSMVLGESENLCSFYGFGVLLYVMDSSSTVILFWR